MTCKEEDGDDHRKDLKLGFAEEWEDSRKVNVPPAKGKDQMKLEVKNTNTKKPTTLPIPSIRAAQAFPAAWSEEGIVSTRRARSTACTALIAKSMRQTARMASHIVRTSF